MSVLYSLSRMVEGQLTSAIFISAFDKQCDPYIISSKPKISLHFHCILAFQGTCMVSVHIQNSQEWVQFFLHWESHLVYIKKLYIIANFISDDDEYQYLITQCICNILMCECTYTLSHIVGERYGESSTVGTWPEKIRETVRVSTRSDHRWGRCSLVYYYKPQL